MTTLDHVRKPGTIAIAAIMVLHTIIAVAWCWKGESGHDWEGIIRSDAKGYYGYLQALFVRGDLGNEPDAWEYVQHTPTGTLNKYFSGTAVMMAPWFVLGRSIALISDDAPKDGTSGWEYMMIGFGALVYELLGLLAFRSLLRELGVRERIIILMVLAIGLGTTLIQYATLQPGWSHVYSFCAVSAFLLAAQRFSRSGSKRWVLTSGALLGLIMLIRPVNGLIPLALPMVWGKHSPHALRSLWRNKAAILGAIVLVLAVGGIQLFLWHAQTGNWIEQGYRGEGFHWDRPQVLQVLFGFRRGLFLWTPLLLLCLLAVINQLRNDAWRGWSGLIYWAVNTYVISSWWIWYYGSGFGSRVYIDHYPALFLPLALVLNKSALRTVRSATVIIGCLVALHLFQFWQFHVRIVHHESMDRNKYAWAFGKCDEAYRDRLGGNYQAPWFNPNGKELLIRAYTDLEGPDRYWKGGRVKAHQQALSSSSVCVYDTITEFGTAFIAPAGSVPLGRSLYLEVSLFRYEERAGDSFHMLGVAEVVRPDGSKSYYEPFRMNLIPGERDGEWKQQVYGIPLPGLKEGEEVRFYLWNQHLRSRCLIDDLSMKLWVTRPF
ncbi:MAG: hypothetical protein KDB88_05935 [Flavobacteriales bacterium]|nr:hypothetical protein [Flavobacteriales bacterium]